MSAAWQVYRLLDLWLKSRLPPDQAASFRVSEALNGYFHGAERMTQARGVMVVG